MSAKRVIPKQRLLAACLLGGHLDLCLVLWKLAAFGTCKYLCLLEYFSLGYTQAEELFVLEQLVV